MTDPHPNHGHPYDTLPSDLEAVERQDAQRAKAAGLGLVLVAGLTILTAIPSVCAALIMRVVQ